MTMGYFCINRVETGSRITMFRKAMHLSRDGLAWLLAERGVEVSITSIGKWERGEVDISFEFAQELAKVFGCRLYGELVVGHLREIEDDRDRLVPFYFPLWCILSELKS